MIGTSDQSFFFFFLVFINIITYIIGASSDGGKYTTSHKLKKTPIFITIKQVLLAGRSL